MNHSHHVNTDDQQQLIEALRRRVEADWFEDLRLCLPVVLELIAKSHDRPVQEIAPAIRGVVWDRCTGKACETAARDHEQTVERHVQLLVEELEKIRNREIRRGSWSENDTPPQMFG